MNDDVKDIVEKLSNTIYIIDNYTHDKKLYNQFIEMIYDFIKAGFEVRELRECPVYFKFRDVEGAIIHGLQLRHFLTNLFFWGPFVELEAYDCIDEKHVVDCTRLSSDYIKRYIDEMIIVPHRTRVSNEKMNKILSNLIFNLSRIPTDFNIILGLSMNMESFINVAKKNPRFNEIIRTKLDENAQPSDIEDLLNRLMKEEVEILMNEDNMLKPMLRSGTGIKHKQLAEFSISGGLKPSLEGKTLPVPINSNLVVGGLSGVANYFIDSTGGRKSLIMNKAVMGLLKAPIYSNVYSKLF